MKMLGHFMWLALGRVAGVALQMVSMIYVARHSSVGDFGLLASALGVGLVLQTFFDFGANTFVLKSRAQRDEASVHSGFTFGLMGAAGMLACSLPLACVVSYITDTGITFIVLALALCSDRIVELGLAVHTGDQIGWRVTASIVVRRMVTLVAVLQLHGSLGALLAFAIGMFVGSLIWLSTDWMLWLRSSIAIQTGLRMKGLAASCRPYWFNSLAVQSRNVDVVLVAMLAGEAAAGLYGIAARITTPLRIFPTSFAAAMLPHAARIDKGDWKAVSTSIYLVTALSAALFTSVALLFPVLAVPLLGNAYSGATTLVQLACAGLVFAALASQLSSILTAWDRATDVAVASVVSTVLTLALIVILCPAWGAPGAAIALSVGYVAQCCRLLWVARGTRREEACLEQLS